MISIMIVVIFQLKLIYSNYANNHVKFADGIGLGKH